LKKRLSLFFGGFPEGELLCVGEVAEVELFTEFVFFDEEDKMGTLYRC
jgi:hypothetical protein